ncbi:MAG: flippase-like domain-containing protein, partial [Chloroflexi bacterium]|nr:flippase-like domain-containing protein [Chloroflexota bacterium]
MPKRRIAVGLFVSGAFLALLLRQVDRAELGDALAAIDTRWLVAAFAVELGALWVRALRWRLVLDGTVRIRTREAWSLVVIGYAANNVLPVRAGELVRAQLLHEAHAVSRLAALGTIVVERILDGLVLALLLAATIAVAGGNPLLRAVAALAVGGFLAATALVAVLALRPGASAALVALLRFAPARVRPAARR